MNTSSYSQQHINSQLQQPLLWSINQEATVSVYFTTEQYSPVIGRYTHSTKSGNSKITSLPVSFL